MKIRTLLFLGLACLAPATLRAQSAIAEIAPIPPMTPAAPMPARAPRVASAPLALAPAVWEAASIPPPPPQAPTAPKAAPAPPAVLAVAPPAPPAAPRPRGQMINVRIEVTLSDSKGTAKTLTMTVADSESGMNRTSSTRKVDASYTDFFFNADARPEVSGSKIRLGLTADANVPVDATSALKLSLRQSQTLILNDGETVEIARAADPVSDRAFTLTVKATIQR
ncbi:MAG: hypothetical protein ABI672_08945 [Vicinamibacteria bacterium]